MNEKNSKNKIYLEKRDEIEKKYRRIKIPWFHFSKPYSECTGSWLQSSISKMNQAHPQ